MRAAAFLCLLFACVLSGCANTRLSCNAARQARTLTEIEEQQVLDNIAMFASNPGTTPYFALPNGGATQTTQSATIGTILLWNPTTLLTENASLSGTGGLQVNWTLKPINEPERISLMKCVYLHVTRQCAAEECNRCEMNLYNFFGSDYAMCDVPTCWFSVTDKKPCGSDCCCKVGHYCGTYVCVSDDYYEYLSRVTVAILDIATVDSVALSSRLGGSKKSVQIEETFDVGAGEKKRTIKGTLKISDDDYKALKASSTKSSNEKGVIEDIEGLDKRITPLDSIEGTRPRRDSGSSFESLLQLQSGR